MTVSGKLEITPLPNKPLGASVTLPRGVTDPSKLSDEDFKTLQAALETYLVLVIPNQAELPPTSQYDLTVRFDPSCQGSYGHDEKLFHHKESVLAKDGKCIPDRTEVVMVGNGSFEAGHAPGMKAFELEHPSQSTFHKDVLTEEEKANGQTRFYRWHIDSALYGLSPPKVTTLLGIQVPKCDEKQKIIYEDNGEEFELVKGATAFASGATAFKLLSPEDKEKALNTTVVYAPHPYIFIGKTKATSDGLTIVSEGKEIGLDKLPPWEESKVKKLPMVWTNPTTGEHHLQVHGCCVYQLINNKTGEVTELEEARKEVHRLMRPAISPQHIYAHAWNKGDLAIFFNQGVWHSVTGEFQPHENRLMHQCNVASGYDPVTKV
ncbi:hypothetical protein PP7435_CHR3-0885 [Komagataella phaffii CBS 7435]|uniref:TauD/TfdA-like domain-containing protein n=2 Tax=Komagataella phaffii TaxID=460519 RepID=C4R484_KOMPG|nr:Hypothetical protein PAS_chr3_0332 [Komagataella phaffii GS115]AOA63996.1 GQ67_03391T0 [Komagataella phaffii]CAH2449881.1 hypothetical protein BQ9382_C3-4685 [Komagataella phaffii CBS 7435]AOA68662.1 GQ68_03360T0 [Komagataella phaffii GS115]CAY70370.1 Hypothetical protein PAS_chr3_0332 [Komagataella phaffii GS115]CCA39837.1 hypothetical protein PP7435_CHR3-0885 [Komagataella phaffii CBS 7435]